MAKTIVVGEVLQGLVEGRTSENQKAPLPMASSWSASPPGRVSIQPLPDGVSCTITGVAPGDCTVTVTCGGLPPATYDISVLPGAATRMVVRMG